jgi:hypothetical protein
MHVLDRMDIHDIYYLMKFKKKKEYNMIVQI